MARRPASPPSPRGTAGPDPDAVAEALHHHAIQLLRLVRREDLATGVSAARLSALSVLVFGGPSTLGALARAEQVSAPTMSRLVKAMEREGWVRRGSDAVDARRSRLAATAAAHRLLQRGRERRVRALARGLAGLPRAQRAALAESLAPLEALVAALREEGRRPRRWSGRAVDSVTRCRRRFD